ncbi:MAG: 2-amino-4-hydroxy-6-hydroxymethyldihydropteridine diphosphokinase [Bacteroidota bacterium]|nr:2-amino-4-hydroxy-6-hydroxymethyldihydropteridine diphosphokinase [Bacteroidota bacterium]
MKNPNQIVLSIGSNKGDRLSYINRCIELIHTTIAPVIQVSKVYKTPSWGFKADDFYNCALWICSDKTPQELLTALKQIEEKLGRTHKTTKEYQSREIDIDIVYYGSEVIAQKDLTIPHPHMQDRLFVLKPMADLQIDIIHPLLNKSVQQLTETTTDTSSIEIVCDLNIPFAEN